MKEHNKKLMIIVGVLLLVVGVSFAYFISSVLIGGSGAKTKLNTASINGATIEVNGTLSFNDLDIYPGHQTVSGIELIATGQGEFVPYNLVWNGTNTLTTPLKFKVYKTDSKIEVSVTCNKTTKIENGSQILAEECNISNIEQLGNAIYSGTINKNEEKATLSNAEFITATSEGNKVYYYVVLEYPNLEESQNTDIGGTLSGRVTVEENNASADITIASIYKEESGNYTEVKNIPEVGYILNEEKSTCTNNAKPTWNNETKSLQVSSLTISGTECNLYFEEELATKKLKEMGLTANRGTPDFSKIATTDEGIFGVEDGMYGGTSYYWRGAATTNYLRFANYCWRIIRINGDGSLRLIYDGTICHQNGEITTDSIAVSNVAYNTLYDQSNYVGWTYEGVLQRPTNNLTATSSNAKTQIENWYSTNITGANAMKVANGKYCNDRNIQSGSTWNITGIQFAYAGVDRLWNEYRPTLSCLSGDVYVLNIGLIMADEVMYAGGKEENNSLYYLYNGQSFWTMSSNQWSSSNSRAYVFYISSSGHLGSANVSRANVGLHPVINLRSDVTLTGNGTLDNPYIVAD